MMGYICLFKVLIRHRINITYSYRQHNCTYSSEARITIIDDPLMTTLFTVAEAESLLLAGFNVDSFTEAVATMFSCALDSGDSRQLVLAASAIWALIFNCNKVRI